MTSPNKSRTRTEMHQRFPNRTMNAQGAGIHVIGTNYWNSPPPISFINMFGKEKCSNLVLIFKEFPGYILITMQIKTKHVIASEGSISHWVTSHPSPLTDAEAEAHRCDSPGSEHHSVLRNFKIRIHWMDLTCSKSHGQQVAEPSLSSSLTKPWQWFTAPNPNL